MKVPGSSKGLPELPVDIIKKEEKSPPFCTMEEDDLNCTRFKYF